MSTTINNVNLQSPNFGKGVNKGVNKEVDAKAAPKKMSTTSKVMIGLGAVATAAIATIAVKNKMAANAAKKAAQELGIDVDLYKFLKKEGIEIKKTQTADYQECLDWISEKVNLHGEDKLVGGGCAFAPSKMVKQCFADEGANFNFPEKSFMMTINNGDANYGMRLVLPETYSQEFTDKIGKVFDKDLVHLVRFEK